VFESLTGRLQGALERIARRGTLRDKDIQQGMRDVRLALLEADVHFRVVKGFIARVSQKAKGEDILKSLRPGEQVVKVVHEELIHLLGDAAVPLKLAPNAITAILVCGLHGSGKTSTCGKLGHFLAREGHRPLLCAVDIYRPAAIDQLHVVGEQAGVPVFSMGTNRPLDIVNACMSKAKSDGHDVVIIDTAGRLHIDEEMMEELEQLESSLQHRETLLVVDSMTGQDAVNVAEEFGRRLHLDGVVLTKLDGDARGGAALSVREITGKPIKFVTVAETVDGLEPFHPDRMASRILGMGDILTLIEHAQRDLDQDQAAQIIQKVGEGTLTLEDFRNHLGQVRKMGPIQQLVQMIPGLQDQAMLDAEVDEKDLDHMAAVIDSMTMAERLNPGILNASRKRRVARGSGMRVQDVNIVLKQFNEFQYMMKDMLASGGRQMPQPRVKQVRAPLRFR
jgi:signal recognition particle subunit SRP54